MPKDFFCFRRIGVLVEQFDEAFRAGDGAADAGLAVLVIDIHLDQFDPGRCFLRKERFGKNFFFHDFRIAGPHDPVDAVVVAVVVQNIGALLRPCDPLGHVAPAERGFGGDGARFGIHLAPDIAGIVAHDFLNERIIGVVIRTLAPGQEFIEAVRVVSICQRHENFLLFFLCKAGCPSKGGQERVLRLLYRTGVCFVKSFQVQFSATGRGLKIFDTEALKIASTGFLRHVHPVHAGVQRSLTAPRQHSVHAFVFSLKKGFDASVFHVAHPSRKAEAKRGSQRFRTKENPLHTP